MAENKVSADEAQDALNTVQNAERAGLSTAVPPRWFGVAIAIVTGGIVGSAAVDNTALLALCIAGIAVATGLRQRSQGATPLSFSSVKIGILAITGFVLFAIALIGGADIAIHRYGLSWAPLAAGGLMGTVVYFLSVAERRSYFSKIRGD